MTIELKILNIGLKIASEKFWSKFELNCGIWICTGLLDHSENLKI